MLEDVITGKKLFKRLPQADERGRIAGGQRNVEATFIAERSARASAKNQGTIDERIAQENALEEYAQANGIWIEDYLSEYGEYLDHGAENTVYWDENNPTIVTKINDLALHETPLEFFDRISIHNNLFPQAPYTVIGFTRKNGVFSVIIQQPFIIAERGLEYEEVAAYMKQLGFEDMGKTYVNDTYIIDDLHPGNILKTPQGNIIVIDDVACLNTEDEDFDGCQQYGELF